MGEGGPLRTELDDSRDGKYVVTYTLQYAGQHSVEIRVNGQPLTGSPCVVQVLAHQYQFGFKFGSRGEREGEFHFIRDIAVNDKTGTIAVADKCEKRIQLFSSSGKFQKEIRLDGYPLSVAFTDSGNLLTLVSGSNNELLLFSEEGQFFKHINDKYLKEPLQLSVTSDGCLIVTDIGSKEIIVLSSDGNDLLLSFATPDCDKYPQCAVYYLDKFYVSYPCNHCVKVFDKTGIYLHDIGCEGSNDGQFLCPVGLIIDKYNQLIVCDVDNGRLQYFTLTGKFLSKLWDEYFSPRYVAIKLITMTIVSLLPF